MKAILKDGRKVLVGWRYKKCEKEVMANSKSKTVEQDCTECFIKNENKEEIAKIVITRHFKDPIDKPYARKKTFKMLIAQFGKEDRKILWSAFLESVKIR